MRRKLLKEELEQVYLCDGASPSEIGAKHGVSNVTIRNWLKSHKIPIRNLSETRLNGKIKPTREQLKTMYLDQEMNTYEIAKIVGVANVSISRWLKGYGIPMRTLSESMLKGVVKPSKEELERLYLDEWMNTYKIGELLRVSNVTIIAWLNKYEIPMRSNSEVHFKNRVVKPSKIELEKMYLEDKMNTYEIGDMVGVSDRLIGVWLIEYDIQVRSGSEARLNADLSGERSPAWKGGMSFLPYCYRFNTKLKDKIRVRDDFTCQNCGIDENGQKHNIHHIHYDKENCFADLITVCNSCNAKANFNRDTWEAYYMNKLNDRGLLHWTLSNGT